MSVHSANTYIVNPQRCMRSEGYSTWFVCRSVCVSVTPHLTTRVIIRATNELINSAEGQNFP